MLWNIKFKIKLILLVFFTLIILRPFINKNIIKIYIASNQLINLLTLKNDQCFPPEIKTLPKNSVLIIGHALGSHKKSIQRNNSGISPKIIDFYNNNKENIKTIIF